MSLKNKILIVEDEIVIAMYIKELLESYDYEVPAIAKSGEDAIFKAKELEPDLVIMDIQLKGEIDGIEASKQIKNSLKIPIIFLTGNFDSVTIQRTSETNPASILIKPVREEDLFASISSALYKQELRKRFYWNEINYRTVFDNMKDGVAVYQAIDDGEDFIFVSFNKAGERIENVKQEDLIGKSVAKVFPGVKEFGLFDVFKRVYKTGKPETHPITSYQDNRVSGWRENYVYKLPTGEIVAIYSDETPRKKAEEEVQKQYEMFYNVTELSSSAMLIYEPTGKIIFVNKMVEEIFEIEKEKLLTLNLLESPPNMTDFNGNPIKKEDFVFSIIRRTKNKIKNLYFVANFPENRKKILAISGTPILDEKGNIDKIAISIEDVTEIMNMKDKLIEQNDNLIFANEKLQQANEELEETNEELQTSMKELEKTNMKLEIKKEENELLIYNMKERMKELQCLYNISNIIETHQPLDEILTKIIDEIPPAFQYPEITVSKITYKDKTFISNNFKETEWQLSSDIKISKKQEGKIEVFYLEKKPACYKGPFFKEEINLVDTIAKRIGKLIEAVQYENDLKTYINFMEAFIDTIPNPVFSKDKNGIYTNCNKAFSEKILGLPKNQIIGKTLYDFSEEKIPKEYVEKFHNKDIEILTNKGLQIYDSFIMCSDGILREFSIYRSTFDNLDGSISGIVGIMVDITQQKEMERELKHSEEKYKAIIEDQTELVCRYFADGTLTFVNDAYCKYFNKTKEALIGKSFLTFLPQNSVEKFYKNIQSLTSENPFITYEHKVILETGEIVWQVWTDRAIFDENNNAIEYQGVGRDITEQKKIELALIKSEKQYRQLVENLNEGIWLINKNVDTVFVNKTMADMLGYKTNEMMGKSLFNFIKKEDIELVNKQLEQRKEGIKDKHNFDFIKKDGTIITTLLGASPIINEDGTYEGTLAVITDITKQLEAENEIKRSLREKEVLLREVHHRVKNNLQIIISLIKLQSRFIKDDKYVEQFKDAENRIRSMALVHENLYRYKDFTQINLKDLITDIVQQLIFSYSINRSRINLIIDVEDICLTIEKAIPCAQIINELISNSLKYAITKEKQTEIKVSFAKKNKDKYILNISDNGKGIPKTISFKEPTTLGLQLIQSLTAQMDGIITLDTSNGTSFTIEF